MEKIILNLTGYQITFIVVWFVIAFYTDWRMYIAKKNFQSKLNEPYYVWKDSYSEKTFKNFLIIFSPIYLIITILLNGLKVFSHKRSIFNGELLK